MLRDALHISYSRKSLQLLLIANTHTHTQIWNRTWRQYTLSQKHTSAKRIARMVSGPSQAQSHTVWISKYIFFLPPFSAVPLLRVSSSAFFLVHSVLTKLILFAKQSETSTIYGTRQRDAGRFVWDCVCFSCFFLMSVRIRAVRLECRFCARWSVAHRAMFCACKLGVGVCGKIRLCWPAFDGFRLKVCIRFESTCAKQFSNAVDWEKSLVWGGFEWCGCD